MLTLEAVGKHNNRDDCFIIIHGKVYDVSKFLLDHPGGEEVLFEFAGKDATDVFEQIGHSEDARTLLNDMFVDDFEGGDSVKPTEKENTKTALPQKAGSELSPFLFVPVLAFVGYCIFKYFQ
jgi:cytochrome b involved in lipid metabolism